VEDFGGKITTEDPPGRAVGSKGDVAIRGSRAVGENGAVLDEEFVGKRMVADEDGRMRTDGKSEEWPILGLEFSENGF